LEAYTTIKDKRKLFEKIIADGLFVPLFQLKLVGHSVLFCPVFHLIPPFVIESLSNI